MSWKVFWYDRPVYQRIGAVVAVALSVFHIYTALFGTLDALMQRAIHLGLGLILVFLVHTTGRSAKGRTTGKLDLLSITAVVMMIGYLFYRYEWITVNRFILVSPVAWYEKILGVIAILLVLEGARRVISPGLLYVGVAFLIYPLIGPYLPGVLHSATVGWTSVVEFNYLSLGGIFGIPLGVSATEIALFIIFGSVLMRSGGSFLISNIASVVAGRYMGGAGEGCCCGQFIDGNDLWERYSQCGHGWQYHHPNDEKSRLSSEFCSGSGGSGFLRRADYASGDGRRCLCHVLLQWYPLY